MEQDDGREFIMQNLVKFPDSEIPHPVSGEPSDPRDVLDGYFGPFSRALLGRAGHPVFAGAKVGGYIDSWEAAPDPGWQVTSLIRYRNRRDLMALATDPQFDDIHAFKIAAIEQTASFPTQRLFSFYLSPAVFMPLILLLVASLSQNLLTFFNRR